MIFPIAEVRNQVLANLAGGIFADGRSNAFFKQDRRRAAVCATSRYPRQTTFLGEIVSVDQCSGVRELPKPLSLEEPGLQLSAFCRTVKRSNSLSPGLSLLDLGSGPSTMFHGGHVIRACKTSKSGVSRGAGRCWLAMRAAPLLPALLWTRILSIRSSISPFPLVNS